METISKEVATVIGEVTYSFEVTFYYYPGTYSIDPTEGEDMELKGWDIGVIHAWHSDGHEWFVEDVAEIKMVEDWTSFGYEFENCF